MKIKYEQPSVTVLGLCAEDILTGSINPGISDVLKIGGAGDGLEITWKDFIS